MSMPSDGARFAGMHSGGRVAAASPVSVRFTTGGLELRDDTGRDARTWPYEALRSAVPLLKGAPDVLLSLQPDGIETLFVEDPSFAQFLLARAPALSAGRQRWRGMKPGLGVLAAVASIVSAVWLLDLHPAQTVARLMPQEARVRLGGAVVASMAKDRKICETPASAAALSRLTSRLAMAASDKPLPLRVLVLDWSLVNAFAVPGGQIILTRGLIQQATSPDEVAGVLSHELGHALELHPEAGIVRALGMAAAIQLAFAGSQGTASNIGLVLTQLRYTRIAEREADAHALRILKGAGISPKGFGDFFERIEGKPSKPESDRRYMDLEVLSTHPAPAERLSNIRAQANYPATPAMSADDWRALGEACGPPVRPVPPASSARPSASPTPAGPTPSSTPGPAGNAAEAATARDIAEATKALAANPADVAALQKRARAYSKQNRHELALADYARAAAIKPDDAALHYGRGLALQSLRRHDEALRALDEALRLAPTYANALNSRGHTYRALKRYDDALRDFDALVRVQPNFIHGYYNRALVKREMDRDEESVRDFGVTLDRDKGYTAAYTGRGMAYEKLGSRDKAIEDFRTALAMPQKYSNGAWAHTAARERLKALGVAAP
jgi:predicted Zn-dependent protease